METAFSSKYAYRGSLINLRVDAVLLPGGRESSREIVEHPGAAAVIPVLEDGKLVLVKQFRKPVESFLLEIPAGKIEEGETPAACAHRELAEETGYKAGLLSEILEIFPSPGYSNEKITIFRAEKLSGAPDRQAPGESISIAEMEPAQVVRLIRTGEIKDAKTIAGILACLT